MIPFKNRTIDLTKPVLVYRNLHKKGYIFSVQQDGKVVAHTDNIILKDCKFIVNKSGVQCVMILRVVLVLSCIMI